MRRILLAAAMTLAIGGCADDELCPDLVSEPTMPGVISEPTMPGVISEPTMPGVISEPTMPGVISEPTMPGGGATVEESVPTVIDDPCVVAQQPDDDDQIKEPCGPNGCGGKPSGMRIIGGFINEPIGP